MRPLIKDGELLPIREAPASGVRPGDVVLYSVGGKPLLHRVWWKSPGKVWLKDDTGTVSLHKVPERKVLGLLDAGRPLTRGWLGLLFSLANTAAFSTARKVKRLLRRSS